MDAKQIRGHFDLDHNAAAVAEKFGEIKTGPWPASPRSMILRRIYVVPLCLFVLIPISFLITYSIAVLNDHVIAGFPYISDTGTLAPESCIFGQLMNIAAFGLCLCVYIRYLEIKHYPELTPSDNAVTPRMNKAALVLGQLSCVGLDLVANFQETNVIVVHLLGAVLCFGFGTIYFGFQAWISHKMPDLASRRLVIIRIVFVCVCILSIALTIIGAFISFLQYEGDYTDFNNRWSPEQSGWEWHLVSTSNEWILCITFCLLILTFVPEFYDLELLSPIVQRRVKKSKEKHDTDL